MLLSIRDFERLDLRIGEVVKAERLRKKLFKLEVDVGEKQVQTIAGGGEHYNPEYFLGKQVVILANMEPKMIAGAWSEGMLLAADHKGKPVWLTAEEKVLNGTKIR